MVEYDKKVFILYKYNKGKSFGKKIIDVVDSYEKKNRIITRFKCRNCHYKIVYIRKGYDLIFIGGHRIERIDRMKKVFLYSKYDMCGPSDLIKIYDDEKKVERRLKDNINTHTYYEFYLNRKESLNLVKVQKK